MLTLILKFFFIIVIYNCVYKQFKSRIITGEKF